MGGPGSGQDPRDAIAKLEGHRPKIDPRAATLHGLYIGEGRDGAALMNCAHCALRDECAAFDDGGKCALERAYIGNRRQQLAQALDASGHDPALHGALVNNAIIAEVRLARAMRYLGKHGELLPGTEETGYLEYQPVAKELPKLQAAVERALNALDLTPKAMREVAGGSQGVDLGALVRAAVVAEEKARADTTDADFTAEDEEAGEDGQREDT